MLLEKCEYDLFSKFTEKVINRYYERDRKNEKGDAVSYIAEDLVISYFIKAIYDSVGTLDIACNDVLHQRIKQVDCLKSLHFLCSEYKNPWAFQQIIATQFDAIMDNANINRDQKTHVLRRSIQELYRITERDLSKYHKMNRLISMDFVIDSYIHDWTSILRKSCLNNDKEIIELVFSFLSSPTIGNDIVEKKLYPCLAINLLMIEVANFDRKQDDKVSLLSFLIKGKYNKFNGIAEYIRIQGYVKSLDLLKCSYISMVRLVEIWKERSGRLSSFDYSPEIFLILASAFIHDSCNYPEILKWTVVDRLPRCDRFPEIIEDIKKTVMSYPAYDPNNRIGKALMSCSDAFESTTYRLENEKTGLISNLDMLNSEAYSLLSNT